MVMCIPFNLHKNKHQNLVKNMHLQIIIDTKSHQPTKMLIWTIEIPKLLNCDDLNIELFNINKNMIWAVLCYYGICSIQYSCETFAIYCIPGRKWLIYIYNTYICPL